MSKIKQKVSITESEDKRIRRQWDKERERWYFSVADVMAVLTESVDARNYWKVLKSRLNKTHHELVTDCYQLKLKASDGKSYMVDTADADTMLKIIQFVAPFNVQVFRSWFDHIDIQSSVNSNNKSSDTTPTSGESTNIVRPAREEISTVLEPSIDIYENKNEIVVELMLPGTSPDKIIITTNMNTLSIKGTRVRPENIPSENYYHQELMWGEFYKEIELPKLVDVEKVEATESRGLITIKLPKIDRDKNRFIKIKSVRG